MLKEKIDMKQLKVENLKYQEIQLPASLTEAHLKIGSVVD